MQRPTHTFSQGDLFQSYDMEQFKFKNGSGTMRDMRKKYKHSSNKVLATKIFWNFIKLVLSDLVKKGTTFHFPHKTITMFTWKRVDGEEFVKSYRSGKFDNIDFLSSNFTLYIPIFKYFYRGKFKEKNIIVDRSLRDIRDSKVNNGFKYC